MIAYTLPADWSSKRLKYLATYNDEVLLESTDEDVEIDYVEISGVSLSRGVEEIDRVTFGQAPSRARRKVRSGDILISTVRTYLQAIAKVDKASPDLIASTGFCVVRPNEKIDSGFLGWAARSVPFVSEVVSRSVGVSYPAINASELVTIELPLPPLDTQRRIARFLDEKTVRIDGLIEKKRALLDRLAEKRQALITRAVTKGLNPRAPTKHSGIDWLGDIPAHWELGRLKFGTGKIGSGVTPRGGASVYVDSGIMLLRSQNVHFHGLALDDVVFIDDDIDNQMSKTRVSFGDVLLNITGASIGRCCLFDQVNTRANVNQHVCIIRSADLVADFVAMLLASSVGQLQIDLSQNGASREGLNFEELGNFVIPTPPVSEQANITRTMQCQVDEIGEQSLRVLQSIGILEEYRSAVVTAAATGQIKVRF